MPIDVSEIPIANVFRSSPHLPNVLNGRIDVRFKYYHSTKLRKAKRKVVFKLFRSTLKKIFDMCFSATASFSASIVIGTLGVVTFNKSKNSNLKFLGAIPFLFAVQQLTEGFVWLSFNNFNFQFIQETATKAFLFFAWVLWPILMPYSIYKTETPGLKKKINFYLFLLGSASGLHSIYTLLAGNPQPLVNDFHIDYTVSASAFENKIQIIQQLTYVIVTVVPLFVSSLKGAKVLAVANFIALVLAFIFFKHSLPSTWCFFAAILSGIIYWIVRMNSKKIIV